MVCDSQHCVSCQVSSTVRSLLFKCSRWLSRLHDTHYFLFIEILRLSAFFLKYRHIFVGRRPSFQPQFLFAITRFVFLFPESTAAIGGLCLRKNIAHWTRMVALCLWTVSHCARGAVVASVAGHRLCFLELYRNSACSAGERKNIYKWKKKKVLSVFCKLHLIPR